MSNFKTSISRRSRAHRKHHGPRDTCAALGSNALPLRSSPNAPHGLSTVARLSRVLRSAAMRACSAAALRVPRLDRLAGRAAADAELLKEVAQELARLDGCPSRRGGPLKGTQIRARAARCMTAEPAERASVLWRGPRERRAALTCAPAVRQRPESFSWSCHRRARPRGAAHERHHGRMQRGCSAGLEGGRAWRPRRHVLHEEPHRAQKKAEGETHATRRTACSRLS